MSLINCNRKKEKFQLNSAGDLHSPVSTVDVGYFLSFTMSVLTTTTRNRINPVSVSTVEQTSAPYVTYDEVALCTDPNCPVCRAQRRDRRHKHHHRHRHKRHHYKTSKTSFWNGFLPRAESGGSIVSVHSVEVAERRPEYTTTQVTERAVVPVHQTEPQVVSETRTARVADEELAREAWVRESMTLRWQVSSSL